MTLTWLEEIDMKALFSAILMICSVSFTGTNNPTNLISSADLVGSFPKMTILGPLGLRLGEYMTIEGKPCAVGFGGRLTSESLEDISRAGIQSLEVYKVNGVALKAPVIITLTRNAKFKPATYYVIRGYQTGEFGPGNPDPQDPKAVTPQTNYQLWIRFVATKNLTNKKDKETNNGFDRTR